MCLSVWALSKWRLCIYVSGEDKEPLLSLHTNIQLNRGTTFASADDDHTKHKGNKKSDHRQWNCLDTCNRSIIKTMKNDVILYIYVIRLLIYVTLQF